MKKIIACILALLQAVMLISTGFAEEPADGLWYLRTLITDEYEIDVAALGIDGSLELNENGQAMLRQSENEYKGTWRTESGVIYVTMGGSDAEAVIDAGELILVNGSTIMKFTKEKPGDQELAEVNPDAQPEDFNGEWACISLVMSKDGEAIVIPIMTAREQGINIPNILMDNGSMKFIEEDVSSVPGADPEYVLRFEDGSYTNRESGEGQEIFSYVTVHILRDGTLMYSLVRNSEVSIGMCFEKVNTATELQNKR